MDNILSLTALQLAEKIKKQEITAKEAVEAVYHQIENVEEEYHCYITLNKEAALKKARKIDEKIQAGTFSGRLAGVPVAIKDNLCTKGLRTTCASKMLDSFIPSYTAQTVERLEEEGAIIIEKQIWTSLPWVPPQRLLFMVTPEIQEIPNTLLAVHPEARQLRWQQQNVSLH